MPTEVLNQLRVLRENIADALRQDPRYLTLTALDRSIAEISGVLGTSDAGSSALSFESPRSAAPPAAPESREAQVRPVAAAPETGADVQAAQGAKSGRSAQHAPAAGGDTAEGGDDPESDPAGEAETASDSRNETGAEPAVETHPAPHADAPHADAPDHEPAADAHAGHEAPSIVGSQEGSSGYLPMQAKPGAPQYQPAISVKFGRLPNKVDLRPLMPPAGDQGGTRCCVADAAASAYDYLTRKASRQGHAASRLFVYYNARWRDGAQEHDDGSTIQFAIEGLKTFGACQEQLWPFDEHLLAQRPGADAYQDAAAFRIQDGAQVPRRLDAWKQALAEGRPILFGCLLFESFEQCSSNGGVVPMPAPDEIGHAPHGAHAMCCVGYCEAEKVFIVRNCWGADWGDGGYCYMPYAYLMNAKFNDGDSWVFVPKVPGQPPRDAWSDDSAPVTNGGRGVDFPIETHAAEEYEAQDVDLFAAFRQPFNAAVGEDFADYAALAGQGKWSQMERFDVRAFLASTAAIAGISTSLEAELLGDVGTHDD